ncbi:hypothetical protein P9112_000378 [Eukaryota sp. TZLM1-RC]
MADHATASPSVSREVSRETWKVAQDILSELDSIPDSSNNPSFNEHRQTLRKLVKENSTLSQMEQKTNATLCGLLVEIAFFQDKLARIEALAAFIGGGKNFAFEFSRRYHFADNLLETTCSLFLDNLREKTSSLSPELWQSCFPIAIQDIPERSLFSLKFALKKLQRHLLKQFESKDFIVRLSTAKKENSAFANFLIDLKESSSAVLLNQISHVCGLFLNSEQWTVAMKMCCYSWPCKLSNDMFCKCGAGLTLSHLYNRFITYRSTLHDAVRDQIHAMCNSYLIESFVEPLLRSLDINENIKNSEYGKRRADVVVPSFDDVLNVVDVVTVDVCGKNALRNAQSEVSPLMIQNCTNGRNMQIL